MLSSTYTITDIKKELNQAAFYGYDNDADFVTALTYAVERAMYERMYPVTGEADYASILALNKAGLTYEQTMFYYAEIYFSCAEFITLKSQKEKFWKRGIEESESGEGSSFSTSSQSGKDAAAAAYISKANKCLSMAGYYSQAKVKPRQSIHDEVY